MKESPVNNVAPLPVTPLVVAIAVCYLIIAASPLFVKRVEPHDGVILLLFGLALMAIVCSNHLDILTGRLIFAGAMVLAYATGRRAWIVERFVQTESAWQLLSFAGLFVLLLVVLWLPCGRAAWRRDEHRNVLTVVAATSALLVLLSLVMLIMLIGKYPPPQFNPAQTLSVCAQSLEYLGVFAVAFFSPVDTKQWRWTAALVSVLLMVTAVMSFRE